MTEDPFLQWLLEERKEADAVSIDMVIYKYSSANDGSVEKTLNKFLSWLEDEIEAGAGDCPLCRTNGEWITCAEYFKKKIAELRAERK